MTHYSLILAKSSFDEEIRDPPEKPPESRGQGQYYIELSKVQRGIVLTILRN